MSSNSTRCWHCGGPLVNRNGHSRGPLPLIYEVVQTPLFQPVRVHKRCAREAKLKPVTAQPVAVMVDMASANDRTVISQFRGDVIERQFEVIEGDKT